MSKEKRCFVIAPIGPERSDIRRRSDQIFEEVIQPAAEANGYKPVRADQEHTPGMISIQIMQHLADDELVIADLTGHNPNVCYELGMRHAFGKPCIQIKDVADSLPFDVAGMRTVDVDFRFKDSMEECKGKIMRQIEEIDKNPGKIQSPLDFVASLKAIDKNDAQANMMLNIYSVVQNLSSNFRELNSKVGGISPPTFASNILSNAEEDRMLNCRHCGFDYLQLGKPVTHYVGDEYDKTNPQGTRGNWIEIPCECEKCSGITTINVSFHKGYVYVMSFSKTTIPQFENISRVSNSEQESKS